MATPKIVADFETQLASAVSVGATSFTLASATDDDGVSLPAGKYYFTIENGSSNKEYVVGTVASTAVSSVSTVTRQGAESSGFARAHRAGASVIITDWKTYKDYMDEIALVSAPDADASTKGVAEEATTAEVDAGTATGGTGAELFVAPDALAASIYSTRLPTADEKAALAGSSTPSAASPYVTRNITKTAGATINGATTPVPVYQNDSDNEFYACDANDTGAMKFLGFAVSSGTDGNDIEVQFNGVVSGFTGLSEGEKYYVQDAVGTIGTSPGTYEVLVGVAISETELLIQKGRRYASGRFTQADAGADETTTETTLTIGFRPSHIKVTAFMVDGGDWCTSYGTWTNSVYANTYIQDSATTVNVGSSTSVITTIVEASGALEWQGTITNVTDTAFGISMLQKVTAPDTAYVLWEAFGEL